MINITISHTKIQELGETIKVNFEAELSEYPDDFCEEFFLIPCLQSKQIFEMKLFQGARLTESRIRDEFISRLDMEYEPKTTEKVYEIIKKRLPYAFDQRIQILMPGIKNTSTCNDEEFEDVWRCDDCESLQAYMQVSAQNLDDRDLTIETTCDILEQKIKAWIIIMGMNASLETKERIFSPELCSKLKLEEKVC
jgi:hypothetical protein